jgi:hypothetical protein
MFFLSIHVAQSHSMEEASSNWATTLDRKCQQKGAHKISINNPHILLLISCFIGAHGFLFHFMAHNQRVHISPF